MDPHANQPVTYAGAPLGQSRAAMILIHGRGASPQDILGLVPSLGHPEFSYLAPAARGATWYPQTFMADIHANEPFLSSALATIDRLVTSLAAGGMPMERVVLLGFSQGACLASEFAVRHPRRYGGVIAFSGGLIGPPGTSWDEQAGRFDGTPVFFGCSDVDPHIPKARVDESAAVLSRMGAEVTERIYPRMGHLVNDDEVSFLRTLMDRIIAP
jgi:predicted esterase